MLGRFSDENLALTGVFSGGTWSADYPLANLLDDSRFVSKPARQLTPATLANARFDVALMAPRLVNVVALLFHTLSVTAKYRITLAPAGGTLAAPSYQSAWTNVYARVFPSENLAWEAPEWWLGSPRAADLLLWPRHLFIPIEPGLIVSAVRIEIDDAASAYFDIGGVWIGGSWSPVFNFDHGRELALDSRDLREESPSGREYSEERASRRRLTVHWSKLSRNESMKLFDAGRRRGTSRPVILMPDTDDAVSLVREAWPATFETPPGPRLGRPYQDEVDATFREIIA